MKKQKTLLMCLIISMLAWLSIAGYITISQSSYGDVIKLGLVIMAMGAFIIAGVSALGCWFIKTSETSQNDRSLYLMRVASFIWLFINLTQVAT